MHGMSEEQVERSGTDMIGGYAQPGPMTAKELSSSGAFVGHHHYHGPGIRVPQNKQISAADFMALVTVLAQRFAGRGKTPTANQVATAQKIIRKKLIAAHSSVAGGEPVETMGVIKGRLLANQMAGNSTSNSGAFWDRVKSIARSAAPTVLPAAAVAFPVAALTATAITKSQQHQARKAAPAAAPGPEAPASGPVDSSGFLWFGNKENLKAVPAAEGGTIKLLHEGAKNGFRPFKLPSGWTVDEADHTNVKGDGVMGFLGFGSKTIVPYDYEKGYVVLRHQGKKLSQPLVIPDKWKVDDHSNTTISGDDTKTTSVADIIRRAKQGDPKAKAAFMKLAKQKDAERAKYDPDALAEPTMLGDDSKTVPYTVYRAEICRRAKLLCKNGTPTAECMAKAQASVHSEMLKSGVKVKVPGAKPGRATAGPTSSMMRGTQLDEMTEIVGKGLDEMTEIVGRRC